MLMGTFGIGKKSFWFYIRFNHRDDEHREVRLFLYSERIVIDHLLRSGSAMLSAIHEFRNSWNPTEPDKLVILLTNSISP
jgi:hypothetical protein